jgi:hypothetical protein
MHPVISQAIAAERAREFHARAAAAGRARQLRRSAHTRRPGRLPRGGLGPALLAAARPLRGPRAA